MQKISCPLFIICMMALFSSCRIEKHHYTGGFHLVKSSSGKELAACRKTISPASRSDSLQMQAEVESNYPQAEIITAGADSALFLQIEKSSTSTAPKERIFSTQQHLASADTSHLQPRDFEISAKRSIDRLASLQKMAIGLAFISLVSGTIGLLNLIVPVYLSATGIAALAATLGLICFGISLYINYELKKKFRRVQGYDDLWNRLLRLEKNNLYLFIFIALVYAIMNQINRI